MGKSTKWLGKFLGVKKFKSSSKEKPTSGSPPDEEQALNFPAKHQESQLPSETDGDAPMELGNEPSPAAASPIVATSNSATFSFPEGFLGTGNASAIKIQTAFRAFLVTRGVMVDDFVQARRALRALKGLVRLQALVRGHSVRKQAAISHRTVLAIVKFQALARGHRVRSSDEGQSIQKQIWSKRQGSSTPCVEETSDGDAFTGIKVEAKRSKADVSRFDQKIVLYAPNRYTLFRDGDEQAEWWWLELWSGAQHWKPAPLEPANPESDLNSLKNGEANGDPAAANGNVKTPGKRSKVPSYMAATESAKAKARLNSPRSAREVSSPGAEAADKVSPSFKRRFSLPGTQGRFQDPTTHPRRLSFPVRAR